MRLKSRLQYGHPPAWLISDVHSSKRELEREVVIFTNTPS